MNSRIRAAGCDHGMLNRLVMCGWICEPRPSSNRPPERRCTSLAATATLIGDVTVEANASVWYGAVIRADFAPVIVREGANVQDNTVIHVATNGCEIGRGATIGHLCVIHDCAIGEQAVIGNASVILDGA